MPNKTQTRDCVIFIPGLAGDSMDQTIEGLAFRIAGACDLNAENVGAEFYTKTKAVDGLRECDPRVSTIYRKDENKDTGLLDIYKLDYHNSLNGGLESSSLLGKAVRLMLILPESFFRVFRALFLGKSSKTRVEYFQLLFALVILSVLFVYGVILVSALAATIASINPLPELDFYKTAERLKVWPDAVAWLKTLPNIWELLKAFSPTIVVVSTTVALLLPSKFSLKDLISKTAVNCLSVIYYLKLGEGRKSISGRLETLIDDLLRKSKNAATENDAVEYGKIHILAFSFGSIVALDSLFPAGRKPGPAFQYVHTLVTIGCPFDFVRTFWPNYFDGQREFVKDRPRQWLNVYSPLDVLASNFRNDPNVGDDPTVNIRAEQDSASAGVPIPVNVEFNEGLSYSQLSLMSSLMLIGFRAHGMYWGPRQDSEISCFNTLVPKMFDGHEMLG